MISYNFIDNNLYNPSPLYTLCGSFSKNLCYQTNCGIEAYSDALFITSNLTRLVTLMAFKM